MDASVTPDELKNVNACECWKCHKPTPRLNYCVWCGNFLLSTTKPMTMEETKERLNTQMHDRSTQSEKTPTAGEKRPTQENESTKKQRVDE